jgi:hypothetical protein
VDDASDIGHYLLSLPPGNNPIPEDCRDGRADAGRRANAE